MTERREIIDDIDLLLDIMPPRVRQRLSNEEDRKGLVEVVLDLGRIPEARFNDHEIAISTQEVTREDIEHVVQRVGEFGGDNRAGIERTLHRISGIRNRRGEVVGLTCRVGRAVFGTIDIILDLVDSGNSLLLLGKPGVGKCVTADSLILTEQGLVPLADLLPEGQTEDTFEPIEAQVFGMNGLERASHAYSGGYSETIRVMTRQGFSLEGTREHPILVMQEDGTLAFRALRDLRLGDYVAIQRGQQQFGTTTQLPAFEFVRRTNALNGKVPVELTPELARFLAYLIGEGTLTYNDSVSFSNTDSEVQADMIALTEQLFGLELRQHLFRGEWNHKDFRIHSVKVRKFLSHLGLAYKRSADKEIPACILTAPKPIVTAFLQALFEAEGSVYGEHGRVEIASASRTLLTQLHILLLNYGIAANLRGKFDKKYERTYYYLTLLGENVQLFAEEIGFLSTAKRTKLAQALANRGERERNPNLDVIPYQNDRLRELRSYTQAKATTKLARFTHADNRAPSYHTLQSIMADSQQVAEAPIYAELEALLATRYFFDPVKQVEEGEAYVYDLSVPESHSFFSNGFISHNTTLLRETARVLAEQKRVVIVDTSNEIAGDGDIPHPAIGRSRRMQVPTPELQHEIMIEAVENHTPQVIVIDEIGREEEATAARTIAERGVQLVGTAHGNKIDNLMMNPTLSDLVGGIASVTLSDEEARRRGTQKSVLERKAPPTFDVVIEIRDRNTLMVHHDVGGAVDALLRGRELVGEVRQRAESGEILIYTETVNAGDALQRASGRNNREDGGRGDGRREGGREGRERSDRGERGERGDYRVERADTRGTPEAREVRIGNERFITTGQAAARRALAESLGTLAPSTAPTPSITNGVHEDKEGVATAKDPNRTVNLYPYGISQNRLKQAARALGLNVRVVGEVSEANVFITLRSYYRKRPQVVIDAERRGLPVHVLRANTQAQMEEALSTVFGLGAPTDPFEEALRETQDAISEIRRGAATTIDLTPRDPFIRRQQHDLARAANLRSSSHGPEPQRRVRIYAVNSI